MYFIDFINNVNILFYFFIFTPILVYVTGILFFEKKKYLMCIYIFFLLGFFSQLFTYSIGGAVFFLDNIAIRICFEISNFYNTIQWFLFPFFIYYSLIYGINYYNKRLKSKSALFFWLSLIVIFYYPIGFIYMNKFFIILNFFVLFILILFYKQKNIFFIHSIVLVSLKLMFCLNTIYFQNIDFFKYFFVFKSFYFIYYFLLTNLIFFFLRPKKNNF